MTFSALRTPGTSWVTGEDIYHYAGTFDNRSTTEQLKFLARRQVVTPDATVKAAVEKGLDYILAAQFPNGGWPQGYPLEGGYHDSITLNDGAFSNILQLLNEVANADKAWTWLDPIRRQKASEAMQRGITCLLNCR